MDVIIEEKKRFVVKNKKSGAILGEFTRFELAREFAVSMDMVVINKKKR